MSRSPLPTYLQLVDFHRRRILRFLTQGREADARAALIRAELWLEAYVCSATSAAEASKFGRLREGILAQLREYFTTLVA